MQWPIEMDFMIYIRSAIVPASAAAISMLILSRLSEMFLHLKKERRGHETMRKLSDERKAISACKRLFDLILVIPALILLSPTYLLISLLIKMDSAGPVFFKQKRVGMVPFVSGDTTDWSNAIFDMYKFRTMYSDTDPYLHREFMEAYIAGDTDKLIDLEPEVEETEAFKLVNDPRVTRIGNILRKFSLDELPQFWNVLIGNMSLVGPRPPIPYEVELYKPEHFERLTAMPGVTGLWQVSGRTTTTFDEMIHLDLNYIKSQSLWLDIKIVFLTLPAIISSKGAG